MRSSVAFGLLATVMAAGCCCTRSSCREPGPGHAALIGPPATTEASPQSSQAYEAPVQQVPATGADRTLNTFGHAKDYTWLIGRLQKLNTPNTQWKVRYAPLDEEDQWGGSVVLASDVRLNNFNDGDIVYIEGKIIAPRPSLYVSGPLYRVQNIRPYGSRLSALETDEVVE